MPVISGGSGAGLVTARTRLTNAQLLAIPTTTVVVAPAPGAGQLIRFVYGWVEKDFSGGAYTNIVSGTMYFVYDTVSEFDTASVALDATGVSSWLTNTNLRQMSFAPIASSAAGGGVIAPAPSGADLRNTNLGFTIDNSGQDFTGGDAANYMIVSALYLVVAA